MKHDIEYDLGMGALRNLLQTVAPQVEPLDSFPGMVSQLDNYIAGIRADLLKVKDAEL
jgi:hypothetical protein